MDTKSLAATEHTRQEGGEGSQGKIQQVCQKQMQSGSEGHGVESDFNTEMLEFFFLSLKGEF